MLQTPCHPSPAAEPETARDLILRVLLVRRVARWCDVGDNAVHQWLHRGSVTAPVPVARVPAIAAGAVSEGLDFDLGLLWPAMAGRRATDLAPVRAREDVQ